MRARIPKPPIGYWFGHRMSDVTDVDTALTEATEMGRLAKLTKLDNLNRLDTAIHRLTQPHTSQVFQRPAGGGRREVSVKHDPLISTLTGAIRGATSGGAGGRTSNSGMVLNAVALQKLGDLKKQIRASWLTLIHGGAPLVDSLQHGPARSLHLWHQTFTARHDRHLVTPPMLADAASRYVGWMNLIDLMFDPEPVSEFMGTCPQCSAEYLLNDDGERVRAITISYKMVLATCRCCGETWAGPGDFVRLNNGRPPHYDTP